jgi:hypothetical protein
MQSLFQSVKRLISICLVTVLLITSALTIFPAPARAEGDTINNVDCSKSFQPRCGNTSVNPGETVALATGAAVGAVTSSAAALAMVSTAGSVTGLSAAGITSGLATIGATVGGGMAAGFVLTSALPLVGAAAGAYGIYSLWEKVFTDKTPVQSLEKVAVIN